MEKHRLEFLFENVASMDAADRDLVSHYLGVRPIVSCASGISQVRRRRYLWATWKMANWEGVALAEEKQAWALSFSAMLPLPRDWVSPGWTPVGEDEVR